jgi:hypothetical protein
LCEGAFVDGDFARQTSFVSTFWFGICCTLRRNGAFGLLSLWFTKFARRAAGVNVEHRALCTSRKSRHITCFYLVETATRGELIGTSRDVRIRFAVDGLVSVPALLSKFSSLGLGATFPGDVARAEAVFIGQTKVARSFRVVSCLVQQIRRIGKSGAAIKQQTTARCVFVIGHGSVYFSGISTIVN